MKLTCDTKLLLERVQSLIKVIPQKPTHPILGNLLLEVADGKFTVTASDLRSFMSFEVPAEAEEEGSVAAPAKMLLEIIQRFPKENLQIQTKEGDDEIEVKSGKTKYSLRGMSAEEFPDVPQFDRIAKITLPVSEFMSGLNNSLYATSNDETKMVLTGLRMIFKPEGVEFVATDGHRLALKLTNWQSELPEELAVTAPAEALENILSALNIIELERITQRQDLPDQETSVSIEAGKDLVFIQSNELTLVSRLLADQYPNYKSLIPKGFDRALTVDRRALIGAIDRVRLFSGENKLKDLVSVYHISEEHAETEPELRQKFITVSTESEKGKAQERVLVEELKVSDETFVNFFVGINAKFMLETLKAIRTDKVLIRMDIQEKRPIILNPLDRTDRDIDRSEDETQNDLEFDARDIHLIMPVVFVGMMTREKYQNSQSVTSQELDAVQS